MAFASPEEKDGFSYAGDAFYCQSSNFNRHRRVTVPELKAHFNGKVKEDRPAHWYEAQLMHYGLPPSKVKGTAHKRLFDAVKKGDLKVPANITKIENDLKKAWNKKEREAKKVVKESTAAKSSPATGTKRKASQASTSIAVQYNTSYTIYNSGSLNIQNGEPSSKKAKTAKSTPAKTAPKKDVNKTTTTTRAPTASKKKDVPKTTTTKRAPTAPKSSTKAISQRAGPPRPKTTAASNSRAVNCGHDDAPPPYSEVDSRSAPASSSYGARSQQSSPLPKLGLLNGRYEVRCPDIEDEFPEYMTRLSLIVTMDGNMLWVKFDLGTLTGMISLPRPWDSSEELHLMHWRGQSNEPYQGQGFFNVDADYLAGDWNYLVFLGDGHIRGSISRDGDDDILFEARRLPGQGTRSEVTPAQAHEEWDRLGQDV